MLLIRNEDQGIIETCQFYCGMWVTGHNVTVLSMGGGRHAARQAPIRSEVLEGISQRAPVAHLFVVDRDERGRDEIERLERRLGERVHVLERRELENYLLIPRVILEAIREKYSDQANILQRVKATSEEEIHELLRTTASGLYGKVLIKRIRAAIRGLGDNLMPDELVEALEPKAREADLVAVLLTELQTRLREHIEQQDIESVIREGRERLDAEWSDTTRHLALAPGEELLRVAFRHCGGAYDKAKDAPRIARYMDPGEVAEEIQLLIGRAVAASKVEDQQSGVGSDVRDGKPKRGRPPHPVPARAYQPPSAPRRPRAGVPRQRRPRVPRGSCEAPQGGGEAHEAPSWEGVQWHCLRAHHLEWIRQALLERDAAPATVNLTLSVLKGILGRARDLDLLTAEEYDRLRRVKGATNDWEPPGRSFTPGELDALVRACREDRSRAGVRDAAIFAVLYIGGVRRAELADLTPSDYSPDPPTIRVRRGKGGKQRSLPLTGGAAAAVQDWLEARGPFPGKFFVPVSQRGEIAGDSLTPHAIYKILAKRAKAAGVAHLSPHDFRRTFIVMCTKCGHENEVHNSAHIYGTSYQG